VQTVPDIRTLKINPDTLIYTHTLEDPQTITDTTSTSSALPSTTTTTTAVAAAACQQQQSSRFVNEAGL
jgi:hypothetical protein